MPDAAKRIAETMRQESIHPEHVTRELVGTYVRHYSERALAAGHHALIDSRATTEAVLAELTGFGALQPYLDDPTVEELWINSPTNVFIARGGVSQQLRIALTADDVRLLVDRMLAHTGRRVDLSQPFVDASLPDGSRLHVAIPDITRQHWSVNIRKFHRNIQTLPALSERGMLSLSSAEFLRHAMRAGSNIVVSGPTHAGKTTMLSALLAACTSNDRIVTVEETFEIACDLPDVVALQCRPANLEGAGEISLRRLVKEALRMRPDRLVVGEVREAESLDLLIALNSGIPGLATIHANSARDALMKLCTLPLLAGRNIDANFVVPTVASAVDFVVHCRRNHAGHRYVSEIIAPSGGHANGIIEASVLFRADSAAPHQLSATGLSPGRRDKFDAAGIDIAHLLAAA